MQKLGLTTVLAVSVALLGCGGGGSSTTTVIQKTVTKTTSVGATDDASASDSTAPAEEGVETNDASSSPSSQGNSIVVPDVVGKDHQFAQDTMQAAGLYNLSEEDATGQGRLMLIDRNWTVVEQDPPAGTRVHEDATITLRSKKDGE